MSLMGDAVRWANVVLAAIALTLMVTTLTRRWHLLPSRVRRIGLAFSLLLGTVAYGSGEAAAQDVPPGLRVVLMTTSLLGLVFALGWRFDEDA